MEITAVEWVIEQIDNKDMGEIPMWIYDFCYDAKELEKQQIENAYRFGIQDEFVIGSEQYYNENYGKAN